MKKVFESKKNPILIRTSKTSNLILEHTVGAKAEARRHVRLRRPPSACLASHDVEMLFFLGRPEMTTLPQPKK